MHGAFSDFTLTPLEVTGMHGTAAVRFRMSGKHTGEFQGMPATGRDVSIEGVDIVKLGMDLKAREHWGFVDEVGLLTQLGAIPEQGQATADEAAARART
jgi:predicted ester cyclase